MGYHWNHLCGWSCLGLESAIYPSNFSGEHTVLSKILNHIYQIIVIVMHQMIIMSLAQIDLHRWSYFLILNHSRTTTYIIYVYIPYHTIPYHTIPYHTILYIYRYRRYIHTYTLYRIYIYILCIYIYICICIPLQLGTQKNQGSPCCSVKPRVCLELW